MELTEICNDEHLERSSKRGRRKKSEIKSELIQGVYLDDDGALVLTGELVAQIFSIPLFVLQTEWVSKHGCPKKDKDQYRIADVYKWKCGVNMGKDTSPEAKKLRAEADYKEAKARQEEVRLKEMLGELVDLEILKGELSTCFTNIRQMLLQLPNDVRVHVHTLYPESATGISEIVEDKIRKTLDELARCGNTTTHRAVEGKPMGDDKSISTTLCSTTETDSE